jgi:hypothetical protein
MLKCYKLVERNLEMASQSLLFTEPLYTETGLWCELADGIDPARWADMARRLGGLSPDQFKKAEKRLLPDPDSQNPASNGCSPSIRPTVPTCHWSASARC